MQIQKGGKKVFRHTVVPILMMSAAMGVLCGCSDSVRPGRPVVKSELAPCPDSPNCISTTERNPSKHVDPLRVSMATDDAVALLLGVLKETKRARIVTVGERYVHAEFTSRIFRFVDDVEFLLDDQNALLHMRSASRVGYYDFGANRRRLKALAQRLRESGFQ